MKRREEMVDLALAALRQEFPATAGYDERQLESTTEDLVDFLSAAVYVQDSRLFTDFLAWMTTILAARHVSPTSLTVPLRGCWEALYDFPRARGHLEAGLSTAASLS